MERGIIFNIKGNLASVAQDFDKVTLITRRQQRHR